MAVPNGIALTNHIATAHTGHLWCTTRLYIGLTTVSYIYIYTFINDLDTNIVRKMSKFADDTKICHGAKNQDDKMELQEDINKQVEYTNK